MGSPAKKLKSDPMRWIRFTTASDPEHPDYVRVSFTVVGYWPEAKFDGGIAASRFDRFAIDALRPYAHVGGDRARAYNAAMDRLERGEASVMLDRFGEIGWWEQKPSSVSSHSDVTIRMKIPPWGFNPCCLRGRHAGRRLLDFCVHWLKEG
jgi:hypothetical protein